MSFTMPVYMIDFTAKTIASIKSKDARSGDIVDIDVYERTNVESKLSGKGQRSKEDRDMFKVTTVFNDVTNEHDWNFTILCESADRSKIRRN
jgi:hypothetical protein